MTTTFDDFKEIPKAPVYLEPHSSMTFTTKSPIEAII